MLRLTFHAALGDLAVQSRATYFRFCADATLRGPDNSLAATRVDGFWRIGQRLFRQMDCLGPVLLRVRRTPSAVPISMGPYNVVRAADGLMYGDDVCLSLRTPGWDSGLDACHEVSLLDAASK
jgi:hypothetical protein